MYDLGDLNNYIISSQYHDLITSKLISFFPRDSVHTFLVLFSMTHTHDIFGKFDPQCFRLFLIFNYILTVEKPVFIVTPHAPHLVG